MTTTTTTGRIPSTGWILTSCLLLFLLFGLQNDVIRMSHGFSVGRQNPTKVSGFERISIGDINNIKTSSSSSSSLFRQPRRPSDSSSVILKYTPLNARMGGTSENKNDNDDDDAEAEYQRKVAEAKAAIEEAKQARDKYFRNKNNNLALAKTTMARKKISTNSNDSNDDTNTNNDIISIRSRIEYTDAGTLIINIPPRGTSTNSVFAGAFSAAWFSAIVPTTLSTGGAGLLFMLPFWAAGGMVAKQAVVDPYLSFRLSIGQYAWSLRRTYAGKAATVKSVEGATETLRGAVVDVGIIVNEVPQYELRLYTSASSSLTSSGGSGGGGGEDPASNGDVTTLGLGLPLEELEYLAKEINSHLEQVKNFPDNVELLEGRQLL